MSYPPSKKQQEAAAAYVKDMAQRFGLAHWRLEVAEPHEHGNDDESDAETFVHTYTDKFKVYLNKSWWESDADDQRRTVVHEMMHPHLDRAWTDVLDAAADAIGGPAKEVLKVRTTHEVERSIERLSFVMAPFFPLPEGTT